MSHTYPLQLSIVFKFFLSGLNYARRVTWRFLIPYILKMFFSKISLKITVKV